MTTGQSKAISVTRLLVLLHFTDESEIRRNIILFPGFLSAWAEFRDDFLWGHSDNRGLNTHVFLKTVDPIAVRETLNPNGPSDYYITAPPSSTLPDKSRYTGGDHYVRLILQVLPILKQPGCLFHNRTQTEEQLTEAVHALGYLIHVLRNQYRPNLMGNLSRLVQKHAPQSRHVMCARQFDNPRYGLADSGDGADENDRKNGPRGKSMTLDPTTSPAGQDMTTKRKASAAPGLRHNNNNTQPPVRAQTQVPSSDSIPQRPLPLPSGSLQRQQQQQQQRQQQRQRQQQQQPQQPQQRPHHHHVFLHHHHHHPNVLIRRATAAPSSTAAPIPTGPAPTAMMMNMGTPTERPIKRSQSAISDGSSPSSPHTMPPAKVARTDSVESATAVVLRRGGGEVAVREDKREVDSSALRVEGGLSLGHRILLEQVRVAVRGWRESDATDREMMGVWQERCERALRELREAGADELGEVWEALEEIKKEQAAYEGRVE